jgi:hypothetical protein
LDFASKVGAEYAIVQNPVPDWIKKQVVYQNSNFSLVKIW